MAAGSCDDETAASAQIRAPGWVFDELQVARLAARDQG